MKHRNNNIKNELAYFYKVIKNMDTKEQIKQKKINEHEINFDEVLHDMVFDNHDMDKLIKDKNLLGWIDMIEDQKLHTAVKSLSLDEQSLLSYIFEKGKTQCELAEMYKISQPAINLKLKILIKIIRDKIN